MESSPTKRSIYSFSAGPSQLPREILLKARDELLNWKSTGFSVLEVSHRGKEFEETLKKTEENFRKLLNIPKNFKVLFMQGGASLQFAMIPMNLLKGKKSVNYLTTGQWSIKAYEEAAKYAKVNQVRVLPKDKKYNTVPNQSEWTIDPEAAYFHYCDNETIDGVEFHYVPDSKGQLLVCDMSSNIASREIDWSKYAVVYGGAQKNLGPSGVTVVVVREDLLDKNVLPITPTMCNWKIAADNVSMYNTPPVFAIYMANLYFEHMLAEGGIAHYQKLSEQKSKLLYDVIDGSKGFYINPVDKKFRSRMNVVFRVKNDEKLENEFIAEAKKVGLIELKGHRSVGGIRASIYNGMPLDAIVKLCDFMVTFMKKKGDASPKSGSPKL